MTTWQYGRGIPAETLVARDLWQRGWYVYWFAPQAYAHAEVLPMLSLTESAIGHAPDLLACHPTRGVAFVEVVHPLPNHVDVALEVRKLCALDDWANVGAVWIADASTLTARQHVSGRWWTECASDVTTRTNIGSGTPYVFLRRRTFKDFDNVFGPTCRSADANGNAKTSSAT